MSEALHSGTYAPIPLKKSVLACGDIGTRVGRAISPSQAAMARGPFGRSLASFLRFCAAAARWNSSRAPFGPRGRASGALEVGEQHLHLLPLPAWAAFSDDDRCRRLPEWMVWPAETRVAGRCTGLYQCSDQDCRQQITLTTRTPLHATKLPLRTWLVGPVVHLAIRQRDLLDPAGRNHRGQPAYRPSSAFLPAPSRSARTGRCFWASQARVRAVTSISWTSRISASFNRASCC